MIEPTDEMRQAIGAACYDQLNDDERDAVAFAVLAIVERDMRQSVAEEIARAIEVAEGVRCPDCGGKPASTKWKGMARLGRCGGGHAWEVRSRDWRNAAAVAREHSGGSGQ